MDSQSPMFDEKFILKHFQAEQLSVPKGKSLFNEGEPNDFVFFILSGAIKVSRKKWVIGITYPNEFVGITSCISDGVSYTFSSVALEDSTLLQIKKEEFKALLISNLVFSKYIIEILCERIKLTDLKTSNFLDSPPERRIILELLSSVTSSQGKHISQISFRDLSQLSGAPMRLVRKLIQKFVNEGILEIAQPNQLVFHDKIRLEHMLNAF